MIEIIKNTINLIMIFINTIYNFEIDFYDDIKIKVGTLVLAFIFFAILIYYVLYTLGFLNEKGDD